jgi:hypothetical protein
MKLTNKQADEIECLDYFCMPIHHYSDKSNSLNMLYKSQKGKLYQITEDKDGYTPEHAYFQISDQGVLSLATTSIPRLAQLIDAKKWRLRMIDLYEQGVLDGSVGYSTLLDDGDKPVPKSVAVFIAKTMFKGLDKDKVIRYMESDYTD